MGWEADTTIDPGSDKGQSLQFVPRAHKQLQHEVRILLDSVKDTIQLLYTVWYLLNSVRKIEIYQDQQMCRRTRRFGGIDDVNQEIRDEADAQDRLEIQDRNRGKMEVQDQR